MKNSTKLTILVIIVLLIDQISKIWIKTNMGLGEEINIFGLDWARIHFVENEGMAFGITLGGSGSWGKLALSIFRIIAVTFLIYYIRLLIQAKASFGLLCCFALILAGAIGNILDSAFYGLIFSETPFHTGGVAEMFPEEGGYAGFLYGKVVDMLYFPMFRGTFPEWFPFWAGEPFLFFRPVFNVADTAITIGVLSLLIFHRSFFSKKSPFETEEEQGEDGTTKAEATIAENNPEASQNGMLQQESETEEIPDGSEGEEEKEA